MKVKLGSFTIIVIIISVFIVGCSDNGEKLDNLNIEIIDLKESIAIKEKEMLELQEVNSGLITMAEESKVWLELDPEVRELILETIKDIDFGSYELESSSEDKSYLSNIKGPLKLYSDNGDMVFLGEVTSNEYNSDSIFNEYGSHGSKYNSESIWNEYGSYGSKYSSYSAFNSYASNPPIIMDGNFNIVGRLTQNKYAIDAIDPYDIKLFLERLGL